MFARNVKWAMFLLSAALLSCSQQDDIISNDVADGTEITTTVSLAVPDAVGSRTVPDVYADGSNQYFGGSGEPSVKNVDLGTHPLYFTVGIYLKKVDTENNTTEWVLVDKQYKQQNNGVTDASAYFNFSLLKGQKYYIVAYADFKNVERDLENIPVVPTLNDELSDAFYVCEEFTADEALTTVLKRPFGKLRLIARDFNTLAKGEVCKINSIEVTYKDRAVALDIDRFNAITGNFEKSSGEEGTGTGEETGYTFTALPVVYAQEHQAADAPYAAVFTMYLPANYGTPVTNSTTGKLEPQDWPYPFEVKVNYTNADGQDVDLVRPFDFDIPIKHNWLTTVDVAHFWTDNTGVTVSIDPRFDGSIDYTIPTETVNTYSELTQAVAKIENSDEKTGRIVLGSDIVVAGTGYQKGLRIGYWNLPRDENNKPIPTASTKKSVTVYLDLNGHTLSAGEGVEFTGYGLVTVYGPNTLIIDDTSREADGAIENILGKDQQTIIAWRYGANIIINAGTIRNKTYSEDIYLGDDISYVGSVADGYLGLTPSKLTINGGWFETVGMPEGNPVLINLFNGKTPVHPDAQGYGQVIIKGGSFVNFDPRKGDNVSGTMTNHWVNETTHTVLTETIFGNTVYTVIPNDTPAYY